MTDRIPEPNPWMACNYECDKCELAGAHTDDCPRAHDAFTVGPLEDLCGRCFTYHRGECL